ncbi:MAG: Outer membrane efflux protein [Limisphaerales bacterium]|nr:MAG: Outer membrane efflux protein [Limisphaerales bacterium]KAG0508289.1 MAG: Outer membrane efflux protein [Limisphaerales bacterium]TXT49604.1 MAG: Outer membrane efflux protein [Limisphaerales bacterium]
MNLSPLSSTNSLLPPMKQTLPLLLAALCHTAAFAADQPAGTNAPPAKATNTVSWPTAPLSLRDAVEVALRQNSAVRKSQSDLEATYGVVIQTRAIQMPRVTGSINHTLTDQGAIEQFPGGVFRSPDQAWGVRVQITQSIYEGGKIESAKRTADLTRDQALLQHQTVLADTVLAVRVNYDDALLAVQQIVVQEASIELLKKELQDNQRRFEAGTVPRFNVLRAEVELANARPKLIRARNALRIAKNNLANLLGYDVPRTVVEDIPLQLSGKLEADPTPIELPIALAKALEQRTELAALRKAERLRQEAITNAEAGRKPSAQIYAGVGSKSSRFSQHLTRDISGWDVGWQASWNIFDGWLVKGKVAEAAALHRKSQEELDDFSRRIELDVRTSYSNFIEAKEVLESQKKVQEQAEEALRLANARTEAGTGTQLDVLNAQTALTEARTTQILALRDYSVARARLERAMGVTLKLDGR